MKANLSQKRALKKRDDALVKLSGAVGDFIRYWGFRRIHGQVWTQIYLSQRPLSGADLVKRLRVSKALVSPALAELEEHGLILHSMGDGRTKLYTAVPDVFRVIREILASRELALIQAASHHHLDLVAAEAECAGIGDELDRDRLLKLGQMVSSASAALALVVALASEETVTEWTRLSNEK